MTENVGLYLILKPIVIGGQINFLCKMPSKHIQMLVVMRRAMVCGSWHYN